MTVKAKIAAILVAGFAVAGALSAPMIKIRSVDTADTQAIKIRSAQTQIRSQ